MNLDGSGYALTLLLVGKTPFSTENLKTFLKLFPTKLQKFAYNELLMTISPQARLSFLPWPLDRVQSATGEAFARRNLWTRLDSVQIFSLFWIFFVQDLNQEESSRGLPSVDLSDEPDALIEQIFPSLEESR